MTSLQSVASKLTDSSMEQCIRDCLACYEECMSCIPHCLTQGGNHADPKHIKLMMDCAEACEMSARMMLRKSDFHFEHCAFCAKICDACADSCEAVDPNDSMMQKCAELCRKCAESCRSMAH